MLYDAFGKHPSIAALKSHSFARYGRNNQDFRDSALACQVKINVTPYHQHARLFPNPEPVPGISTTKKLALGQKKEMTPAQHHRKMSLRVGNCKVSKSGTGHHIQTLCITRKFV